MINLYISIYIIDNNVNYNNDNRKKKTIIIKGTQKLFF